MNRKENSELRDQLNVIHKQLQESPNELKCGYQICFGGILNAYREGDVSFTKAIEQFNGILRERERIAFEAGKQLAEYDHHMDEFHGTACKCEPLDYTDFHSWKDKPENINMR